MTVLIAVWLNLDCEDEQQEDNEPVRRRTFVGLTGAATLNAMFADAKPDAPVLKAEPFMNDSGDRFALARSWLSSRHGAP